jgi:hypothetical protein
MCTRKFLITLRPGRRDDRRMPNLLGSEILVHQSKERTASLGQDQICEKRMGKNEMIIKQTNGLKWLCASYFTFSFLTHTHSHKYSRTRTYVANISANQPSFRAGSLFFVFLAVSIWHHLIVVATEKLALFRHTLTGNSLWKREVGVGVGVNGLVIQKCQNRRYDVSLVLFQSLDGAPSRDTGLGGHNLDVLDIQT